MKKIFCAYTVHRQNSARPLAMVVQVVSILPIASFLLLQVPITQTMEFQGSLEGPSSVIPAFRVLDGGGKLLSDAHTPSLPDAKTLVKMYQTMVSVQAMDTIFYDAQRQGRISFYMTCTGAYLL